MNISRSIIIAEIGENHIGDMDIARTLIEKAAAARADYVKFQSYTPQNFKPTDPEYAWFKKVSLSDKDHIMLQKFTHNCGIKFLSSPFSVERAKFLCEDLGMKEIKIASGMMLNFSVLDYINEHAQVVFLSTGMANIEEIKTAVTHLSKVKKCYILHCVTQYPCSDAESNLLAIKALQEAFPKYDIGYSDHTVGYFAPIIAVALGAKVIEKHYTFDKQAKQGTDHILSVTPDELTYMIAQIRRVENILGESVKVPTVSERQIMDFVRSRFV